MPHVLWIFVLLLLPLQADAQEVETVHLNELLEFKRLRLHLDESGDSMVQGRVQTLMGDTLLLAENDLQGAAIPIDQVERILAYQGRSISWGPVVGMSIAGPVIAYGFIKSQYNPSDYDLPAALLFGIPSGFITGLAFGWTIGEEKWQEILLLPATQPGEVGTRIGLAIQMTIPRLR